MDDETTTSLRTDRLALRPVAESDVERILEYRNRPDVTRWLIRTEVDPEAFRAAWKSAADDPDDHSVAVELDGLVIGTVSLELSDGMGQPGMPLRTEAHLGYIFDPDHSGRGYAAEAVAALVDHSFRRLGVRRITAGCFADNAASVRILEKVGMRREQHGVGDSWHAELGWLDGYTYAILADEWERSGSPLS
jgi:RimJ/RimL family protein N-acetyltransferase